MTRFKKSQIFDVSKTTESLPTANRTVPASTLCHVADASTQMFIDMYLLFNNLIILSYTLMILFCYTSYRDPQ
jgi:hypothetical protein